MSNKNKKLSVLPLRNTVLFPQQIIPIYIGRDQSLNLIKAIMKTNDKKIVVTAQKEGAIESPKNKDLYTIGTLARVMKVFDMPDNSKSAIVQGLHRIRIEEFLNDTPYFEAKISPIDDAEVSNIEVTAISENLKKIFNDLIIVAPYLSEEQGNSIGNIQDSGKLCDKIISLINISTKDKQSILEELDIKKRKVTLSIKLLEELQNKEAVSKFSSTLSGKNLPFSSLSDKIVEKKKTKEK